MKELDKNIKKWIKLSAKLKEIKKEEMELRVAIASAVRGAQTLPINIKKKSNGTEIQVLQKEIFNIDAEVLHAIENELSQDEVKAIKYKPSLIMKAYNKLPSNSLLDEAVITKPASPTIKVV